MEGAGRVRVEPEIELILPAEVEARAGQSIVTKLRRRMALGEIGGMRRDAIGDNAGLHIVAVGQAEMFLGRDVAEHGAAEPADHRRTDA